MYRKQPGSFTSQANLRFGNVRTHIWIDSKQHIETTANSVELKRKTGTDQLQYAMLLTSISGPQLFSVQCQLSLSCYLYNILLSTNPLSCKDYPLILCHVSTYPDRYYPVILHDSIPVLLDSILLDVSCNPIIRPAILLSSYPH